MEGDTKIRSGYRVVGFSTGGFLNVWYYPTLDNANSFAKFLAEETGREVDVMKYIGSWKRQDVPVDFIPAEEVS